MEKILLFLLLTSVALSHSLQGFKIRFTARSAKSDLFISLRANKTMTFIDECNKKIRKPYGILEQSYKRGTTKLGEKCTWKLHAQPNHVVNVISVLFAMEDEINPSNTTDDYRTTSISLYDGTQAKENKLLTRYYVSLQEKVGHFVKSMSSGRDMVVEIKYHDNKDFEMQKIIVNYEFLDLNEIKRITGIE
ncbi:uncharacterized protein LOC106648942 [Trichogramma pretiosum]|uniref:uncharacterized protein LOC106648942 n=1 Tax=Trichogramma pretiosum TaxID=7493 RepID=UPI0006C991AF|nr:uncharacterized protein LOC106648942 [Trichogramma pretiosum]